MVEIKLSAKMAGQPSSTTIATACGGPRSVFVLRMGAVRYDWHLPGVRIPEHEDGEHDGNYRVRALFAMLMPGQRV
jgi:hypothetical protein